MLSDRRERFVCFSRAKLVDAIIRYGRTVVTTENVAPTNLALVVGAHVPDGQQPVVAHHAAVPADTDPGQLYVGPGDRRHRRQVGRVGRDVAELDQRL